MANEKFVFKNPVFIMNPGASGGSPAPNGATAQTDLSNFVKQVTVTVAKTDVDVSALGDTGDRHAKGSGKHQIVVDFVHARALSATLTPMMKELAGDNSTPFSLLPKNAAKSTDNPLFTLNGSVNSLPLNGQRNQMLGSNCTWPVDGGVTYDDGTTPITL